MEKVILFVTALIPVIIIGIYVYKKDRDKESKRLLIKLFFYGVMACVPVVLTTLVINYFWGDELPKNLLILFVYVLFRIALIEEAFKWFMVYMGTYNDREFNHIYDAIVYSVFVALGFAALENIFYAIEGGINVTLLRSITAVPCHAINAIIMGNYLGLAKMNQIKGNKKEVTKNIILSIALPTIAHAIYDFCTYAEVKWFLFIFIIYIISIVTYGIIKIIQLSKITKELDYNDEAEQYQKALAEHIDSYYDTHCPVCGKDIEKGTTTCENCGADLTR